MHGGFYAHQSVISAFAAGVEYYGAIVSDTIAFAGAANVHQDLNMARPVNADTMIPTSWIEKRPKI